MMPMIPWWNTLPIQTFRADNQIQLHKCGELCICFAQLCPCDWCKFVNKILNIRGERLAKKRVSHGH